MKNKTLTDELIEQLVYLKLPWIREHYDALAAQAAEKSWTPVEFLALPPRD